MFYRRFLILTLMVMISYAAGFSQEKLILTHEKSIEVALKKNLQLKMAEKEITKSKAGIWEAYSNILPQFDLSASFQHSWDIQTQKVPNFSKLMLYDMIPYLPIPGIEDSISEMPDYMDFSFGLENTARAGAVVTQPLFLGGAGLAGIKMAIFAKRATVYNYEETPQNVIYQTTNAFYMCLLAKELFNVQEEALLQAQANLDIVTKKYEVGNASGFDKMLAEVEVANLKPELITSKNNYQSALTQLRTVLGLPRNQIIDIDGSFQFVIDDFGEMPMDDVKNMALQNRPLIKAISEQKNLTKKGIDIARSNFLPKLFFQTDYSYMAMRNDYDFRESDFSKGFTSALSLQIPLFHGFRSSSVYQQAKLDYKIMIDTEKQIYDGVVAETEVAYNKFQEAKEKYLSSNQTVNLAKEALRLANLMYEEGANTQLDVLSSQLALTRAKLSYVNSLYEYQLARYQLRKVVGDLKGIL